MSFVNFVIEDADGDKSTVAIDFAGGFAGNIDGLIETGWALINPLVNGHLVSGSVTLEADISGLVNAAAAAIADVQEKAAFVFASVDGFLKTITLPTVVETIFGSSGGSKQVDVTNTDVAAFITAMEDGFDDGGGTPVEVNPTTSHGEDLITLRKAEQAWGKSRG